MREWIVTNGLGGYASLNYINTNSRKFHGLLVSSLNPPVDRWVFVSNIHDQFQTKKKKYDLKDYKCKFNFDLFPSFTYDINKLKIKKTIFMENEKNTTIIRYKIKTSKPIILTHNPIINSRHFYDVNKHRYLAFDYEIFKNGIKIKPRNIDKSIKILLEDSEFHPLEYWDVLYYGNDLERNESWVDNNVQIGQFKKYIKKSTEYFLIMTTEENININPSEAYLKEKKRKKTLLDNANLPQKFDKLVLSTDNFIVRKEEGKSVIAGYHWFADWGRDTLISLPGLTLVTKRFNDAKQILRNFSRYLRNGLIPNTFNDKDSTIYYNTVDASLWYVDRVYQYLKYTNDRYFLSEVWNSLHSIIESYMNGTDFDIKMDGDYLISHAPGLTWMDVKINDYYPTPRARKAVEIQALWYNALRIMSNLSQISGREDIYFDLSERVKESFKFQYDKQYDVIDTKDTSIRPNQIFLVSLDFNMIDEILQDRIVNTVQDKLLTIFGLRTLSTDDPNYKGNFIGPYNKDIAYHNGTVWPWLLGPFIKAFLKVRKFDYASRKYAYSNFLEPMLEVFDDKWDGSINEIYDGDPIYTPRGCISQAWSVAEILRSWVEDINYIPPVNEKIFELPEICV
ncbi:MAG: glycogen debranching enzyme family protein [Thermoplasmatales archaeon]|nr:MAG: glycogen debranching enzyme family protein [Thermoplasmatales archaeon]